MAPRAWPRSEWGRRTPTQPPEVHNDVGLPRGHAACSQSNRRRQTKTLTAIMANLLRSWFPRRASLACLTGWFTTKQRLQSAVVLAAFVSGLGLPLLGLALDDVQGSSCRPGGCCCAPAGAGTRILPTCPCGREGGPRAPSSQASDSPALLPSSLPGPSLVQDPTGVPPGTARPRSWPGEVLDPPPRSLLS